MDSETDTDTDADNDTDTDLDTDNDTDTDIDTDVDTSEGTDTGWDTSTCPNDVMMTDYTINNQMQLELLAGYAIVAGNLYIEDTTVIEIDELACLTQVGGDLFIIENTDLLNLEGLSNLGYVGGELRLFFNDSLPNLDGLASLTQIYNLRMDGQDSLVDIDGLDNLETVEGFILIESCEAIESVEGLFQVENMGEGEQLTLRNNTSLPNCQAIELRDVLIETGWTPDVCIYNNLDDICDDDVSGC